MKTYSVKDWSDLYENNRTRDMKEMKWVPVPNRHDGDGYTILVDRPNGAAMLGCWLAILQVASKCEKRGTLLREGGKPHDAASISRITRLPQNLISECLILLETECKWLIVSAPQEGAEKPQEGAGFPQASDYGKEGKGIEGKGKEERAPALDEEFAETPSWLEFWGYCQTQECLLPAEWFARDKFEAAQQDHWRGKSNWRAYARRCKGWWEQDGRPSSRNRSKRPESKQMEEVIQIPILK